MVKRKNQNDNSPENAVWGSFPEQNHKALHRDQPQHMYSVYICTYDKRQHHRIPQYSSTSVLHRVCRVGRGCALAFLVKRSSLAAILTESDILHTEYMNVQIHTCIV